VQNIKKYDGDLRIIVRVFVIPQVVILPSFQIVKGTQQGEQLYSLAKTPLE
jgi:hypothetical protein